VTNKKLEDNVAHEAEYNNSLLKEMTELREKNLWQEAVVKETRLEIDGVYKEYAEKEATIDSQRERLQIL
jgi:hypothetical protein